MIDRLLTDDLAVLARDNRQQLPALDATLRKVGPPVATDDVLLIAMSRVYVHRVARIAGGAVALAGALLFLALAGLPFGKTTMNGYGHGLAIEVPLKAVTFVFVRTPFELGIDTLMLALLAGAMAMRTAERRLERTLGQSDNALASVRERARRAEGWATSLVIVGVSLLIVVLLIPTFALGLGCTGSVELDAWAAFTYTGDDRIGAFMTVVLQNTVLAAAIAMVGSVVIARAVQRGARWTRWLEQPIASVISVVVAVFVVLLGCRFATGSVGEYFCGTAQLASGLRALLGSATALSVVFGTTCLTLRRRSGESQADPDTRRR